MSNSKHKRLIGITLFLLVTIFMSTWWITRPTITALIQGDDWLGVCKAVIKLKLNEQHVVQIRSNPMVYLEQTEGMLGLYFEKNRCKVEYVPELMYCKYWTKNGIIKNLRGHKCGEKYTLWVEE